MLKKVIAAILSSSIAFSLPINTIGSTKYRAIRANAADAESNTEKAVKLGDPNNDGIIDAVDASLILANYTKFSTTSDIPDEYDLATSDINNDNLIDAVDASTVLSYYAYSSVGGKLDFAEYLKDPNGEPSETTATTTASATTTTITTSSNTTTTVSQTTVTSVVSSTVSTAESTTSATTTTTIPEDLDTDSDGLTDVYENFIGTDVNKADTDGDGLTDYQEFNITYTDPLVRDSVTKDVSDADADCDNDGLSNAEEIKLETDANDSDTDSDGLKDGEEVKTYKTDPLKYDTDGDTISDGDEVKLKTDPTKASSDGTTSDKDRKFVQKLDKDSDVFSTINTDDNPFKVSMEIKASGYAGSCLNADESGYSSMISSDMVLGVIPAFEYEEGLEVDDVVLNFDIDSKYTSNTNGKYAAVSEDFKGIKRLNVFKYFDDINMLLPVETTYDEENKRVSTHVDELGTYCLIDMEKWHENLGITPDEYKSASVKPVINSLPRVLRMFAPDTPQVTNSDELDVVFHVFSKEGDALNKSCSDIKETAEKLFNIYGETGKVHIIISAYTGALATVDGKQTYASNKEELEKMFENVPGIPTSYKLSDLVKYINKYMASLGNSYDDIKRADGDKYYVLIDRAGIEAYENEFPHYYELFSNRFDNVFKPVILSNLLDYKSIATEYDGFFYQKSINFATPVYEFIISSRSHKTPQIISPIGWKELKLEAPITNDYKDLADKIDSDEFWGSHDTYDSIKDKYADTDKDGLLDLQEISYSVKSKAKGVDNIKLEWDEEGNVILPTFGECMKTKSDMFYVYEYIDNMEQWKINLYSKFRVLPILSDPMSVDGDKDCINDIDEEKKERLIVSPIQIDDSLIDDSVFYSSDYVPDDDTSSMYNNVSLGVTKVADTEIYRQLFKAIDPSLSDEDLKKISPPEDYKRQLTFKRENLPSGVDAKFNLQIDTSTDYAITIDKCRNISDKEVTVICKSRFQPSSDKELAPYSVFAIPTEDGFYQKTYWYDFNAFYTDEFRISIDNKSISGEYNISLSHNNNVYAPYGGNVYFEKSISRKKSFTDLVYYGNSPSVNGVVLYFSEENLKAPFVSYDGTPLESSFDWKPETYDFAGNLKTRIDYLFFPEGIVLGEKPDAFDWKGLFDTTSVICTFIGVVAFIVQPEITFTVMEGSLALGDAMTLVGGATTAVSLCLGHDPIKIKHDDFLNKLGGEIKICKSDFGDYNLKYKNLEKHIPFMDGYIIESDDDWDHWDGIYINRYLNWSETNEFRGIVTPNTTVNLRQYIYEDID